MFRFRHLFALILLLVLALAHACVAPAQELNRIDRERVLAMLNNLRSELKKNYFDANFKGLDMETRFTQAEEKIRQSKSLAQAVSEVAWALDGLSDSHTFFFPPARTTKSDYGWEMAMMGNQCFITAVRPGSDAEKQGVKPGDEILKLNGYTVTRPDLWKMKYVFNVLKPQPGLRLDLRAPDGATRTVQVAAKVIKSKIVMDGTSDADFWDLVREIENVNHATASRYTEMGDDLMIWEMPDFEISERLVDGVMDKARNHKALILDLRGNGGGHSKTLVRLVSNFFEHEVKVCEKVGRKERAKDLKPEIAKPRGKIFTGKLIVLVSSESASAAEMFARIVQLEKRGTVIGDVTAGAVMTSMGHQYEIGAGTAIGYAASITMADVIMSDGGRLEGAGVTPDKLMLPPPADMAAGRDPVLAHAAELCGVKLSPEVAGKLFPIRWVNP